MSEDERELRVRAEDAESKSGSESDSGSGSGSGNESEEEDTKIEWLATTREKRANAGNRLHSLLQQEDPDDELELLFQEDENDNGFSEKDANDSDVQMDSSSDEEDQGPAAGDDMEGEKELQRQAKAEKAKKRKFEGGVPKMFKKRVKIDPTIAQTPAPRPKKKSERASWLPAADEAPTRSSGRRSTKIMKEQLHAQMVDREIKRLRQLANMEKAAAAKEAAKKPAMTQADRLAEAARVEKANSKSLSRWEEAEQQREEEQKAKLLALKNRTLDGPVITWWSGMAEWVGGKLKHVGKNLVIEEKEKPVARKKKGAELEADAAAADADAGTVAAASTKLEVVTTHTGSEMDVDKPKEVGGATQDSSRSVPQDSKPAPLEPSNDPETPPKPESTVDPVPTEKLSPQIQPPVAMMVAPPSPKITPAPHYNYGPPKSSFLAPPAGLPLFAPPPSMQHKPFYQTQIYNSYSPSPAILDGSAPVPGLGFHIPPQPSFSTSSSTTPSISKPTIITAAVSAPPQPPAPPAIEHAALNYIILQNFDETLIKDKTVQTQILFAGRKFVKCPKPRDANEKCVITLQPARYRDPETGLPYRDAKAYKEIQRLKKGDYKWSKLVGAYVGLGTYAAKGVPDRFKGKEKEKEKVLAGNEAEFGVPLGPGVVVGTGPAAFKAANPPVQTPRKR